MSTDLNFQRGYTPPSGDHVDLNFTLNPDGVATAGVLALTQSPPTLQFSGTADPSLPRVGQLTISQPVATLSFTAIYNTSVWRGVAIERTSAHEQGQHVSAASSSSFDESAHLKPTVSPSYDEAAHVRKATEVRFKQASTVKVADGDAFQEAAPLRHGYDGTWEYPPHIKVSTSDRFEAAVPVRGKTLREVFEYPNHIKVDRGVSYDAVQRRTNKSANLGLADGAKLRKATRLPWEETNKRLVWGVDPKPPGPPEIPKPYEASTLLDFICPWLDYEGSDILLNFAKKPCGTDEPEPPKDTVIVPVKRVYIVLNSVMLRRVDGNVELPTFSLSMNIDADSWTWGFTASLPIETEDAITPASDGTPVELEVMMNGQAYRLLAEKIQRDRTFGRKALAVSGKGKAAMLDGPYAPIRNFSNTEARTAQQLMNDALTINGASIGWTVDWRITDWLVPPGAWSHQGTYVSALNAIAGAAGAYIQPDPVQQKLIVLPRYPVAPWNWSTVTPDYELPADVTTREGIEWLERPRYNRVYVSGQGQGVVGQVTRAGTAGEVIAPMIVDSLITHADAARQRGLAILGDTGRQAHISLSLPVLEETKLITPGKFVRYVDGGVTRLGLVRSVSAASNFPELWQTIGVESHVSA